MQSNRGSIFRDFRMKEYLLRITCPVLAMQGVRDEFGGIRQFEALQEVLPVVQHQMFDAGHLLHREQPDQVVDRVRLFLTQLSPPAGATL
jgi:pimeloyl-ACP methyl ester carboxylesterase